MPLGNVFVFGDFNGRTKDLPDFIQHDELHEAVLDNLPTYSEDIIVPTRTSSDQGINDNGRRLLTLCKSTGIRIVNGRHPGGFSKDFTFCGPRGLSTIDYLLSTADMINFVEKFIVCNFITFSDHAPLHIELPCCLSVNEGTSDHNACFSKVRNSFRWQPELAHFCTEN